MDDEDYFRIWWSSQLEYFDINCCVDSNARMNVPFQRIYQAFVDMFNARLVDFTPKCTLKTYKFMEPVMAISAEDQNLNTLFSEDKLIPTLDRIIHSEKYYESQELVDSIRKHASLKWQMINGFNGTADHLSLRDQINIVRILQCIGELSALRLSKSEMVDKVLLQMNPELHAPEHVKPVQKIDMR